MSDFPVVLTDAVDGPPGVGTEIVAKHLNNLEGKVGIDGSAVTTSLDYLLKNAASIDPGHKHTAGALSGGNNGDVFYKAAGAWGPGTPDAASLVAKAGDQTIAGVKTFSSIPIGPASDPTTANQLARKAYVDLMLPLAGGSMSGNIVMNTHKLTGLGAGTGSGQAVRYDEYIADQDPGHKHSKLWASDGSPEAMTVNATGYVGINTTNPLYNLHVTSAASAYSIVSTDGVVELGFFEGQPVIGGEHAAFFGTKSSHPLYLGVSDALHFVKIANDGKVGINTSSPGYLLTCNGEPGANGYTAWTNYSDIRFKQNPKPIEGDILTRVLKLNPVTFTWNDKNPWGEKPGERTLYGFIAQELQELFPDMVGEAKGPDGEKYLTTNLSNLSLYVVQAIKEQQAQIEALQGKLN